MCVGRPFWHLSKIKFKRVTITIWRQDIILEYPINIPLLLLIHISRFFRSAYAMACYYNITITFIITKKLFEWLDAIKKQMLILAYHTTVLLRKRKQGTIMLL